MAAIHSFDEALLQRVCDVLADTEAGLTGTEIGRLLAEVGIVDPAPAVTKRHRLFNALVGRQRKDSCGNGVAAFIHAAMRPVRYVDRGGVFERRRVALNEMLAFGGYSVGEDGRLHSGIAARTLSEAEQRAGRLRTELQRRGVHGDVLAFCRSELVQSNYFHAVFEATKSVADKIRAKSGCRGDGAELVDRAFGFGAARMPFLAFNAHQTETELSEHKGLMNLLKGMFGAFRNVTAHAPKISWTITEQDALDLLTIASFLHRRLDAAVRTPRTVEP
jgi:uncharacterized protein (TIGR02391 family)